LVVGGHSAIGSGDGDGVIVDHLDIVEEAGNPSHKGIGHKLSLQSRIGIGIGMPGIHGFAGEGIDGQAGIAFLDVVWVNLDVVDQHATGIQIGIEDSAQAGGSPAAMMGEEVSPFRGGRYHSEGQIVVAADHIVVIAVHDRDWGAGESVVRRHPLGKRAGNLRHIYGLEALRARHRLCPQASHSHEQRHYEQHPAFHLCSLAASHLRGHAKSIWRAPLWRSSGYPGSAIL